VLAAVTRTGMALRRAGNTSWGEVGDSGDDGLCPVELNLVSTPARPAANNHRETTATYADNVALPAFTTLTCEMQRFFRPIEGLLRFLQMPQRIRGFLK